MESNTYQKTYWEKCKDKERKKIIMIMFRVINSDLGQQMGLYLNEGATKELAALCRILTPISLTKDALSCSRTNFTVVPEKDFGLQKTDPSP